MSRKEVALTILGVSYAILGVLLVMFVSSVVEKEYTKFAIHVAAQETLIRNEYKSHSYYEEPKGDPVYIKDKSYHVIPGQTFYMDKGPLKLYATATYKDGKISVHGEEYHEDGQLIDGTIKDVFSYDWDSGYYINKSKDIYITYYDGYEIKIEDKRTGICLPFNGVLSLIS